MLAQLHLGNYAYPKKQTKKESICSTLRHFIENRNDNSFNNLTFIIDGCLKNIDRLQFDKANHLLFEKKKCSGSRNLSHYILSEIVSINYK